MKLARIGRQAMVAGATILSLALVSAPVWANPYKGVVPGKHDTAYMEKVFGKSLPADSEVAQGVMAVKYRDKSAHGGFIFVHCKMLDGRIIDIVQPLPPGRASELGKVLETKYSKEKVAYVSSDHDGGFSTAYYFPDRGEALIVKGHNVESIVHYDKAMNPRIKANNPTVQVRALIESSYADVD